MNKKLTAKTQKLIPLVADDQDSFSSSILIEPPEKELILKKGNVYTVFDIKSPTMLNVGLITNVINDVLYDHYYNSDSISPIQSLEKAVLNINDKLASLSAQQTKKSDNIKGFEFNIVAGVLWGNVLYIVQHGSGKSFLMREGDIKEVGSTSEGNFSVASGVIKADDVIVLCTQPFADKFPPDKLLSSAISSNDLDPEQSSIILKFLVDAEFSEEELIDFNLESSKKSNKMASLLDKVKNIKSKKSDGEQAIESLVGASAFSESAKVTKAPEPPSTRTAAQVQSQTQAQTQTQMQPRMQPQTPNATATTALPPLKKSRGQGVKVKSSFKPNFKINKNIILGIVVALLVGSIIKTLIAVNKKGPESGGSAGQSTPSLTKPREPDTPDNLASEKKVESAETVQEEPKVIGAEAQVFYDIKLADETAQPSEVLVFNNTLVTVDTSSGKLFTSTLETPKFTAEESVFKSIKNLINSDGKLSFSDSEGFKTYNLSEAKVESFYAGTFGVVDTYLGNIYSIDGSEVNKYVKSGDALTKSLWASGADFTGAKDMEIAYSIYVLKQNSTVVAYTTGNKTDFELSGLETPLENAVSLVFDNNFDYIYVADAGNKRVVIFDADGAFVNEIVPKAPATWDALKSISVNSAETMLYVLSGTKVYTVDLTNLPDNSGKKEGSGADAANTDRTADTTNITDTTDTVNADGTADVQGASTSSSSSNGSENSVDTNSDTDGDNTTDSANTTESDSTADTAP